METNVARRQDDVEHCTSVCTSLSCISTTHSEQATPCQHQCHSHLCRRIFRRKTSYINIWLYRTFGSSL